MEMNLDHSLHHFNKDASKINNLHVVSGYQWPV